MPNFEVASIDHVGPFPLEWPRMYTRAEKLSVLVYASKIVGSADPRGISVDPDFMDAYNQLYERVMHEKRH